MATVLLWAGGPELVRHEFRQPHMGTEFKLVLYTNDADSARRASDAAFARIVALDLALSDYNPESELMRLCDRAGGPPVPVSDDLFRVLQRAVDVAEQSGGAFDPTIQPVVRLWRRARRQKRFPDRGALERARALVGYRNVRLDPAARTVQLLKRGMKLDLGGIAKGFTADEAIATLKRMGVDRALVAASGDIAVSGPPPGESGWRVGIGPVERSDAPPGYFVRLRDAAVSTSGDAEQFVELDGVRYSHIVDPRTGVGVVDRASVTVVAHDGLTADSLDTAVYVLGPELGLPLVEATPEAAALFVRVAGKRNGPSAQPSPGGRVEKIQKFETSRLATYLEREKPRPAPGNAPGSGCKPSPHAYNEGCELDGWTSPFSFLKAACFSRRDVARCAISP
jgi:thiamine biosynthesis lipoprotein